MSFFTTTIGAILFGLLKDLAMKIAIRKGLPLAMKIVTGLETTSLSGPQKRDVAVNQLFSELTKKKGVPKDIEDHLLNLIIELAVLKVKGAIAKEKKKQGLT